MDISALISVGALFWGALSQAGVKEGMQAEESGMFSQPECFPQGEDAFLALQQGRKEQTTPVVPTWNRDSDVFIL